MINKRILTLLSILSFFLLSVSSFAQEAKIYEKYGVTVETLQPGLSEGDQAFLFKGKDQDGKTYQLKEALKKGPVVVNFFRGSWCPYCTKHLMNVQDSLGMIEAAGATFVAVTPENQERFAKLVEKKGLTFEMVEDSKLDIMNGFKVTFDVNQGYQDMLKKYENDLTVTNSIKRASLPVPATYIIAQDGTIIKRHYDPNYTERMSVKDILSTLQAQ
ncbi:peroxiredoxin family protein [Flammeovirga agarivorans]|uniref:thioredoxin-dependent peroxiredoxin n=1 Tax=Flammeovirga agarivorans TaxID=2726742 RepID=A0A7X8XW90_9BACT|nr:peroxiredoxin-like family protein [Flammeovirga agarivorans]NLR92087.1 AhpC/TSA family protein [Flammeovirga agarivorans]